MRQLILDRNISLGEIIPVEGKQYHYLSRVLRLKPGTIIGVSGKDGISGQCLITEVNPVLQTLFLKCLSLKETGTALEITGKTVPINLFIWMVKSHKMEQIIRQATETGVKNIFPVIGDYTQKQDTQFKAERWSKIILEARQQSGSDIQTEIFPPESFIQAMKVCSTNYTDNYLSIFFYENNLDNGSLHSCLSSDIKGINIAIGPAGGFSPKEAENLQNSGFKPVHFNTNILRTETAVIYALGAIQTIISEKEKWKTR